MFNIFLRYRYTRDFSGLAFNFCIFIFIFFTIIVIKEGNSVQIRNGGSNDNNNSSEARNIGEEVYYAHYLHGAEGLSSSSGQKDIMTVENGCGNSKRKESCYSSESQESLRTILSDPLT